jgi:DNA primase small subunit
MVKSAEVAFTLRPCARGGLAVSSRDFVYEKFFDFYKSPSTVIPPPVSFVQREFAFLLFREKVMVRHRSFASPKALGAFLKDRVPSDVYHSCAYYEYPEAEMERKGWQGADLVFDIDADHIPTSCNKIHDEWTCGNTQCGFSGKGITPENCPICGGVKFETKTWPCDQCLDSAKAETVKLIDMLKNDFGFSDREVHVFFSGHRGYHVHVENEAIKTLDAMARKEIVDYVSGIGLAVFENRGKDQPKRKRGPQVFSLNDYGWNRRLKVGMRKFIANATKEDLKNVGIKKYDVILRNKEAVLKRCLEDDRWNSVKGVSVETWMKLAEHIRDRESAKIDTVVTTDIHRLIRTTGTLHGKTGLLKVEFPISRLDGFDPFREAVAFKEGLAKVLVSDAPEFRLGGETFGPYRNQKVELPTAAAVLLVCKGRAEVVK